MSNELSSAQKPRIVFFGSGPVAGASLERLAAWADIEAVVTKTNRDRKPAPVETLATSLQLPLYFADNRAMLDALIEQQAFRASVGVIIDYGVIVSQATIDSFPLGIINSHFSLLPEWRGADPITFSVLSGQTKTGVSLMLLVPALDEGPLLTVGIHELHGTETTPELTQDLIELSDSLLQTTLPRYIAGEATAVDQLEYARSLTDYPTQPSYSRKLTKLDGKLDWSKSAVQLEREVRAYTGWPKSYTTIGATDVVVTQAHVATVPSAAPGTVSTEQKSLAVATSDGWLVIDTLKPAGKGQMDAASFINGYLRT